MNIDERLKSEKTFKGVAISPGISIGKSFVLFKSEEANFARKLNYEDISAEIDRFYRALEKTKEKILAMKESLNNNLDRQTLQIFDAQSALLSDPLFIGEMVDHIKAKRVNAEYSVKFIANNWKYKLSKLNDQYLAERGEDINEVAQLLIEGLSEITGKKEFCLIEPVIIVAEFLSLADLARLDKDKVKGFIISRSGYTSHAAIVARSLNIPAVSMVKDAHDIVKNNDEVILDGLRGYVVLTPSGDVVDLYQEEYEKFQHRLKLLEKLNEYEPVSKDGVAIELNANIEIVEELPLISKYRAAGIGLFRTEFLVDTSTTFPTQQMQQEYYRRVLSANKDLPVTIRTFDVGGDKMIHEIELRKEDNPFLGWRAIRFQLANRELLKIQIRSALLANEHSNLSLMIPMVTNLQEVLKIKETLKEVEQELKNEGFDVNPYRFGIMVEIPSAALMAHRIAEHVDFFSVGTNDLIQYTLAVDRGNEKVGYLYDAMDPSVLRILKIFMDNVKDSDCSISVCGEMAANPEELLLLLILGIRKFSMVPWKIPVIKKLITSVELRSIGSRLPEIMQLGSSGEIRDYIRSEFASELQSIGEFIFD